MTPEEIKARTAINLKGNPYLKDTSIPYLYQKKMVLMTVLRPRMVNGDDVGIGKTLESIVAHTFFKTANPETKGLIFTEKGSFKQWQREIEWLTTLKARIINTELFPDPQQRISAMRNFDADLLITSYGQVYKYLPYLIEGMAPRFVLYADEPNVFKNIDSQLHKQMFELSHKAARVYGLTATIVENKLEEAFGILRVICPGLIPSLTEFHKEYCVRKKIRRGIVVTVGYRNLDKFRKQIEPGFYGRLQNDPEVSQDLPEDFHKDVDVILSKEQSRKVVEAMDKIIQMPDGEIKQVGILPSLTLAQQIVDDPATLGFDLPSAKAEALLEMLSNSLQGERVIIFSKFRTIIDLLQKRIEKDIGPVVRITGKEDATARNISQERFMSDGANKCPILLITRAGFKSLNLQKCGHVVAFNMPWSYGHYRQFVGRVKRTGSTFKKVLVYRMMAVLHPEIAADYGSEETIDHHSLRVVMRKKELFNAITGDVTDIATSDGELKELFDEIRKSKKAA